MRALTAAVFTATVPRSVLPTQPSRTTTRSTAAEASSAMLLPSQSRTIAPSRAMNQRPVTVEVSIASNTMGKELPMMLRLPSKIQLFRVITPSMVAGIFGEDAITITDSTITGNSAHYDGGGITGGDVSVKDSTISGNWVTGATGVTALGGGISHGTGTLSISGSKIMDNDAGGGSFAGYGGGIYTSSGKVTATSRSRVRRSRVTTPVTTTPTVLAAEFTTVLAL